MPNTQPNRSKELGTEPIPQLLVKMGVPASIGILVMSIYFIVDTIFVGRYVGTLGIAAITVVMPITFLISSLGMSIGVGGASIISRALGGDDRQKAFCTFGNMISLTLILAVTAVLGGILIGEPILRLFGGNGDILPYAKEYFSVILFGVPCLAFAMMSNNVMRSEGQPQMAMWTMLIPAISNIIMDPIFIIYLEMGMSGAAWATTISYYLSAGWSLWYFLSGRSELKIDWEAMRLRWNIIKEIFAIGGVTLARQGTISLLTIVLNNSLFQYGGELAIAIYGIINRVTMFANFPVLGITQGFLPIAGYNFGASHFSRVKETIKTAIGAGTAIAIGLFVLILIFARPIVSLFTNDPELLAAAPSALTVTFYAVPLITMQLIGSAYFQAIGKALPALFLTMTKQGFFLIPFVLILPRFFGLEGIWYAFPVSDILAATVTFLYLRREVRKRLDPMLVEEKAAEVENSAV
ncbi:MAG: MATE family efflux transporter [Saprospiraceae bacterium]